MFQWLWDVGYIDNKDWCVYDGGYVEYNCIDINKVQFSYNVVFLLYGSVFMYNYINGSEIWKMRVDKLWEGMYCDFFEDDIVYEIFCEGCKGVCMVDMLLFKGYVYCWLFVVIKVVLYIWDKIFLVLRMFIEVVVKQCIGGDMGWRCGFYWREGVYVDFVVDKMSGVGEQMNVLVVVFSLLIDDVFFLVNNIIGLSKFNYDVGFRFRGLSELFVFIINGDRVGVVILIIFIFGSVVGFWVWMSFGD